MIVEHKDAIDILQYFGGQISTQYDGNSCMISDVLQATSPT